MARQYVNLGEIYGQVDAARANQAQLQNNQLLQERQRRQFAQEDRAYADDMAIKDIYRAAITPEGELDENRVISDMLKRDPVKALEVKDSFAKRKSEAAKTQSETSKAALESKKATAAYLRDKLATAQDQGSYDAVMVEAQELGAGFVQSAPREFNPEWVRNQLFTADKFLEQSTPKYEKVDLGGKIQVIDVNPMTNPSIKGSQFDKTQTPDSIASTRQQELNRGVQIRGQNMTDARAKEANGAGKAPSGYRYLPDGSLEAIKGGPADKVSKVSEGERKSATLLKRMENSLGQLKTVTDANKGAAKPELTAATIRAITPGETGEALANSLTSGDRQRVESAQLDILDAALTLGTGAAYTKEQLQGYRKSYFPQIGDTPKAVKDKQARLENIIEAGRIAAGNAAPEAAPNVRVVDW